MRLLLDTHICLWFISGDSRLPADWCDSMRDAGNAVFLTAPSF
jgi:PIN domain nuclease of toxin-antitoxin system